MGPNVVFRVSFIVFIAPEGKEEYLGFAPLVYGI